MRDHKRFHFSQEQESEGIDHQNWAVVAGESSYIEGTSIIYI